MNNEQLLEEANYYLNNDVTMSSAAKHFNICKKSFQIHMKKLEEIYPDTFKLVEKKKQQNLALGIIKGGKNGAPSKSLTPHSTKKYTLSKEEASILARKIIEADWSFRQAEGFTGIPKSTISDNLTRERLGNELYEELSIILNEHKPGNRKL